MEPVIFMRPPHLHRFKRLNMKYLASLLLVLTLPGCATIDRSQYQNITFNQDGVVQSIDFKINDRRSENVSLEACVQKHISNEAIKTKDYSTRRGLAGAFAGIFVLFIDPIEGEVEAEDLILESELDQVKAAGRILYAQDSWAPAALRFVIEISGTDSGTHYRYTDLSRFFYEAAGDDLPEEIRGWVPLSTDRSRSDRFELVYQTISSRTDRLQHCLSQTKFTQS